MSKLYLSAIEYFQPEDQLPEGLAAGEGLPAVKTALKAEYLKSTRNEDPYEVEENLVITPTQLGAEAARRALAACSLESSDLDLLIGATCTPLQTIPVESQRLGKELAVKIPAYDINGGSADLALHAETLLSWKADRIPEHTLSVSTHTPTARVNYSSPTNTSPEGELSMSDGGGVALFSKASGIYGVQAAKALLFPNKAQEFVIELYGHMKVAANLGSDFFIPKLTELISSMKNEISDDAVFVEGQLPPALHEELKSQIGGEHRWYSSWELLGNMLGATPYAALSQFIKEDQGKAQQIVVLQSGIGLSVGAIVLRKE